MCMYCQVGTRGNIQEQLTGGTVTVPPVDNTPTLASMGISMPCYLFKCYTAPPGQPQGNLRECQALCTGISIDCYRYLVLG
jgi:hypothetical protein